jgi:hypothetical protein
MMPKAGDSLSPPDPLTREGNVKVFPNEATNDPIGGTSAPVSPSTLHVTNRPTGATPTQNKAAETQQAAVPADTLPANVTFRQDGQGHIYYVLTDGVSGKEIREVPPSEIRKVGEGIAEYLKKEATKGTSHVKIKA